MSQNSIFSDVSSIPPSVIDQDDEEFNEELCHVNDLYFGNLVQVNDISVDGEIASVSDESDNEGHEESDQELEDKENCEFEAFESDNRELHNVQNFLHNTCGCTRLYGKPCSSMIDRDVLVDYRNGCLEMVKSELDLMVKVHFSITEIILLKHPPKNTSQKRGKDRDRNTISMESRSVERHLHLPMVSAERRWILLEGHLIRMDLEQGYMATKENHQNMPLH